MNKLRSKRSKRILLNRRRAKGKGGKGWLRAADMGLFAGFASPIALHLGLLSLAWAITATFLGLTLSGLSVWSWIKSNENTEKDREERAWWS